MKKLPLFLASIAALVLVGCNPPESNEAVHKVSSETPGQTASTEPEVKSEKLAWAANFDDAMKQAKAEDKYVLVKYTAVWCAPCHKMKDEMEETGLTADYDKVILVEVDIDKEKDSTVVKEFMTSPSIPYMVIVDKEGKKVADNGLYTGMPDFLKWVKSTTQA